MSSQGIRPKWWQLYLTFPLLAVLFAVDTQLILPTRGHQAVQIGIVLIVFGLVLLWLRANAIALSRMDQGQDYGKITVIRIPPSQLPETNRDQRPMFQLPDSRIKDLLNYTYGLDYIDVESFPINEDSQGSNKE